MGGFQKGFGAKTSQIKRVVFWFSLLVLVGVAFLSNFCSYFFWKGGGRAKVLGFSKRQSVGDLRFPPLRRLVQCGLHLEFLMVCVATRCRCGLLSFDLEMPGVWQAASEQPKEKRGKHSSGLLPEFTIGMQDVDSSSFG